MLNAVMTDSLFRHEGTSERRCSILAEMGKAALTAQLKQIAIRRKEKILCNILDSAMLFVSVIIKAKFLNLQTTHHLQLK